MRGAIIQELFACLFRRLHAVGLLGHNRAEGRHKCRVNTPAVVQKGADDVLHAIDLLRGQRLGGVGLNVLDLLSVLDRGVLF